MVIKRLSCVFRLSDAGSGRLLTRSEVSFREGGAVIKHEYKPGGYFVLTDLPEGDHTITVTAPGYQQEQAVITVDHARFSALDSVSYVALNPSRRHPAADRYPSVCGSAPGFGTVYAVRAAGNLRVAEERSEAGASEVRMFQETGAPALPALFLLGSGKTSELVMFTGSRDGVYIFSSDRRQLYSLNDGGSPVTRFSVGDFSGGSVYSVYDDSAGGRYVLTLPIFGRGNEVCGYMVLDISRDAVENTLSDISEEYRKQSAALGILCWLTGALMMIHLCKSKEKLFRQGTLVISAAVCMQSALDAAISVFKFSVTIGSIIQQSVSKITMSLQNDLDTVNEKGVALSKIYDLNSWLMENYKDIPFIDNLIYDRNYRITAVISDSYINERTWSYAAALLMMVLLCAGAGLLLTAAVTWIERSVYLFRRNKQNGNNSGAGKTEYAEEGELVPYKNAGK